MCGICGSFVYQGQAINEVASLRAMRDSMLSRGPDAAGDWSSADGRIWLGHRRLSIIDLSDRGAQPMLSANGKIALSFNGEIYNHVELRRQLEARGHVFRGHSDTEVIIEAYRSKGPDFVGDLRGMFAFALWDEDRGCVLLARDPYGIKPLYYASTHDRMVFASSVKALVRSGQVSNRLDPAGVAGFYVFGSVPEPWTIHKSVSALPAGTTMIIDRGGPQPARKYHSIARTIAEAELQAVARDQSFESDTRTVRMGLLDSVRHHLVSDVPIGVYLSAGIDSSSLVGLMRDAGHEDVQTITLAYSEFSGGDSDEAPTAEALANYYGTRHFTRRVGAEEFRVDLPSIVAAMDQPSVDGINSWFVAKAARELGLKVAISGVGGDELFGGYSTFRTLPRLTRLLAAPSRVAGLASLASSAVHAVRGLGIELHPKHAGLLRYGGSTPGSYLLQRGLFLPSELRDGMADREFMSEGLKQLNVLGLFSAELEGGPKTSMGQIAALESSFYLRNQLLRDADWAGMAHSIEVRTPLVDHVLLSRIAPVMMRASPPSGKALMAAAPTRPLPEFITRRKRTGFGIPVESWLNQANDAGARKRHLERPFSRRWARQIATWHELA